MEKCKHHCPCFFEQGECCNCGAVEVHEQDEFKDADLSNKEEKLKEVAVSSSSS